MKTYRNCYAQLCSTENLLLAFRKARKGKTAKPCVQQFEANIVRNLSDLQRELSTKIYQPLPLRTFILRDPKTRKISVSDFRDRIVHHALCNILEPIFEQYFIYDSYANRIGKGVHAALRRFDQFKRKVSKNGRMQRGANDTNMVRGYVLKADIKHYFDTVDHQKLLEVIGKRIQDKDVLNLITKIVNNHYGNIPRKGMPLGNLTSQFFANVYLNELDQFVKHELKARYYLRYVDDFVILHTAPDQLRQWQVAIDHFLERELLLKLHPQKSRILSLGSGIDFLGFRCFYHFRLPRKRNIQQMRRKLERYRTLHQEQKISVAEILESLHGWNAHVQHANSYRLRRAMMNLTLRIIQPYVI